MTIKQLRDDLSELMKSHPNTENNEIYIHTWCWSDEILSEVEKVDIEFDLNDIGRWITIQ